MMKDDRHLEALLPGRRRRLRAAAFQLFRPLPLLLDDAGRPKAVERLLQRLDTGRAGEPDRPVYRWLLVSGVAAGRSNRSRERC